MWPGTLRLVVLRRHGKVLQNRERSASFRCSNHVTVKIQWITFCDHNLHSMFDVFYFSRLSVSLELFFTPPSWLLKSPSLNQWSLLACLVAHRNPDTLLQPCPQPNKTV